MKNKEKRQYRSNQGRSPERQSNAEKVLMWAIVGIIITITVMAAI
tara:strand:- start:225 stop:359 length:135 start_codon:yes stop_codon:yes gene_type:complete